MRITGRLLLAVLVILWIAAVGEWFRSRQKVDSFTFALGDCFFWAMSDSDGVSLRWLTGVSAESLPDSNEMGWVADRVDTTQQGRRRRPTSGTFINIPDATRRSNHFVGIELLHGEGQVLVPVFFFFRKTPLLPLGGVTIPWSVVLTYPLIPPALWAFLILVRRLRAYYRAKPGFCRKCGYDLRGSENRCPECGTPFEQRMVLQQKNADLRA